MSCHDIGLGMNEVVKTTIELYDAKTMDINAAKKIIASCAVAVNWCDGNEYEATAYIRRCRCGKCLKMIPRGEKLYSVWNVSDNVPNPYKIQEKAGIATDGLCAECFDVVICKHCNDPDAGKREMEYIENRYEEDMYKSEGRYPDHNNGRSWPKRTWGVI